MRPIQSDQILDAFDPIDQPLVELPDFKQVDWSELDCLSWRSDGTRRGFMVAELPERMVGIVLKLGVPGEAIPGMCDLCLSSFHRLEKGSNKTAGVKLATVETWDNPRTSVGVYICADLSCSSKVRHGSNLSTMGETISTGRRIERYQERLEKFIRRVSGV